MKLEDQYHNKPGNKGIKRIIKAGGYSIQGLQAAIRYEAAFRQELLLLIVLTPIALWLGDNGIEYAFLIGSLFLVLIVELLNSAIEAIVDRVSTDHHPLSGRSKDIGSAAVFVSLVNAAFIWFFILYFD